MPPIEILLAFAVAALVMNLSPGPSNLYVMARSIGQGTGAGIVAALGLALGSMVHVVATTLGIAAVFEYSPLAYTALKVAGAAYLIYLGIDYLRRRESAAQTDGPVRRRPHMRILRESMLVEITNPKTALFFLAFLPQFADVAAGPLAPQILLLGMIVTLSGLPCDALVAALSGRAGRLLTASSLARRLLDWGFNHFSRVAIVSSGDPVAAVTLDWGVEPEVAAVATDSVVAVLGNEEVRGIRREVEIDSERTAPVAAGDSLGTLRVTTGETLLAAVDLVAQKTVQRKSLWEILMSYF